MRRIISIFLLLVFCPVYAGAEYDIYLKNGSVISGVRSYEASDEKSCHPFWDRFNDDIKERYFEDRREAKLPLKIPGRRTRGKIRRKNRKRPQVRWPHPGAQRTKTIG